ncbi:MAG: hypothetical protein K2W95_08560 [Candidatus Obscuribacterales bacterium]|nr:hypothetical protein [Candidatus Obscuribacterales bacterium]
MPDNTADYKIADKFVSKVEEKFDLLDADKDGKLTSDELRRPRTVKTAEDHYLKPPAASLMSTYRFVVTKKSE